MAFTIENKVSDILIYDDGDKDVNYYPKSSIKVYGSNGSVIIESNGSVVFNQPPAKVSNPSNTGVKDLVEKIYVFIGNVGNGSLRGGYADYSDSATLSSPISVAASAGYVTMTNDGLGSFTNTTQLPEGVTGLYDTSTNKFDWSDLSIGDQVLVRIDFDVIVATNNTEISVDMFLGSGAGAYTLNIAQMNYKTAATYKLSRDLWIYMGNQDTIDNGGYIKMDTDTDLTVKVNGWFVSAFIKES